MKCIDPWLLNNRRQCPVCKRYVFPNQDNSDEEESRQATERTPLLRPSEDDSASNSHFQGAGVSNYPYPPSESSETEVDDESSPPRSTTSHITTTDLVFNQPRTNSERHSSTQLPRVVVRQSTVEENDDEDTAHNTTYGSVQDSTATSFTTPRAANFFVGSLGGTTDNTNISMRSVTEDPSDVDDVEVNQAYVPDDESTHVDPTNL